MTLHLALLWHQHQPDYLERSPEPVTSGEPQPPGERPSSSTASVYRYPWVRLHAIRDYYSMAALVAEHPGVHLTINLTPSLLRQIDDYAEREATDRALELTLRPPASLTLGEREEILAGFFDADWHNQIFPHPRYKELFRRRQGGRTFGEPELRDLQMWFNLAWFGSEFRDGPVELVTGTTVSVDRFVRKERDFSREDIRRMVGAQREILRATVPLHRALQEEGQIEVSTTPYYHPILPLLIDTDRATLDRPGAALPPRFARPEDAEAQVRRAARDYEARFGRPATGMWPAEGAVSREALELMARAGIRWTATDRGVLARSGRWGYDVEDPRVLCRPYRSGEGEAAVAVFFRDTWLSNRIGFNYQGYADPELAARDFLDAVVERFARRIRDEEEAVLTVALDGENAWGAYRDDARPFLHALYGLLERDERVRTVTFSEYLAGNPARGVPPHPLDEAWVLHEPFTGSWIDESGSAPGVDLGTWIGEEEENRAWELLRKARDALDRAGATPESAPAAFEAAYAAEGSDWFWWFGADHDSGNDEEFDDLFRAHLRRVYEAATLLPPPQLERHVVPHAVVWSFTRPVAEIQPGNRLTVRTNCPGMLTWRVDEGTELCQALAPVGGVMAGTRRFHLTIGPFERAATRVRFRFRCTHPGCPGDDICCSPAEHRVEVAGPGR